MRDAQEAKPLFQAQRFLATGVTRRMRVERMASVSRYNLIPTDWAVGLLFGVSLAQPELPYLQQGLSRSHSFSFCGCNRRREGQHYR